VLIVLAHAGMSGFVKPNSNWGKTSEIDGFQDSFNEVAVWVQQQNVIWRGDPPLTAVSLKALLTTRVTHITTGAQAGEGTNILQAREFARHITGYFGRRIFTA